MPLRRLVATSISHSLTRPTRARPGLPPHKVVGITGTNGKSTTTALIHHILKTAGVPSNANFFGDRGVDLKRARLCPHEMEFPAVRTRPCRRSLHRVDPYYLSHLAEEAGHDPRVILAGRKTNDAVGEWIADQLHAERGAPGSVLILGRTFKENVPDLRNSCSFDLVRRLTELGYEVDVADPLASPADLEREHGLELVGLGQEII